MEAGGVAGSVAGSPERPDADPEELATLVRLSKRSLASSLAAADQSCSRISQAARHLASQLLVLGGQARGKQEVNAQRERQQLKLSYLEPYALHADHRKPVRRDSGWHSTVPIYLPKLRRKDLVPLPQLESIAVVAPPELEAEQREASVQQSVDEVQSVLAKLKDAETTAKEAVISGEALLADEAARTKPKSLARKSQALIRRLNLSIEHNDVLVKEVDALVHKSFRSSLAPLERWERPRTGASPRTPRTLPSLSAGASLHSTAMTLDATTGSFASVGDVTQLMA